MDNLSKENSLQIIEDMINTAKREYCGAAYYLTLWGSIVSIYCFVMFLMSYLNYGENSILNSWLWVVFPIGAVFSTLHARRSPDKEKTRSWFDRLYAYVWGGFSICFSLTCVFGYFVGIDHVIPFIIILYGFVSFITGGTTKFTPALIGSVICFICAICAVVNSLTFQFLFAGIGVFFSQVIPGIIMFRQQKKLQNV